MFWIGIACGALAAVVVAALFIWWVHKNPPNFLPW